MGPESEGDGRNFGGQQHSQDSRRYQDRDLGIQDLQLPRPNGPFASENRMTASPTGSAGGRERDRDLDGNDSSGERNRSRPRNGNGRTQSGQLRICKKCGEPLTGQFVRALGGTFHLDCFRCRVCEFYHIWDGRLLTRLPRTVDKL